MTGRRLGTAVLLVVGWMALVATTPPMSTVEGGEAAGVALLDQDHPELRVPFELGASGPAHLGSIHVDADLSYEWLSEAVPLDVFWDTPVQDRRTGTRCWTDCIGTSALVVRWPLEQAGGVLVDWRLVARVEFDVDDPPEGAEIGFQVDPPPDHPGRRRELQVIDGEQPVSGVSVTLESITPDVESFVVAVPDVGDDQPVVFRVGLGTAMEQLDAHHPVNLEQDPLCDGQGCRFEVWAAQVAHRHPNQNPAPVVVALPSGDFDMMVDRLPISMTEAEPVQLRIPQGRGDGIEVVFEVPWDDAYHTFPPPVLDVAVADIGVSLAENDRLVLVSDIDQIQFGPDDTEQPPESLSVPLECDPAAGCRGTVSVGNRDPQRRSPVAELSLESAVHHPDLSGGGVVPLDASAIPR